MKNNIFLKSSQINKIAKEYGTPVFVYDEKSLIKAAKEVVNFPNLFGITPRYSMKACSNKNILNIFIKEGLHIDASSGFEALRAIKVGIPPSKIQIVSQELPYELSKLIEKGVKFVACSLHQLEIYGKLFPNKSVGIRLNPGLGSGHSNRTNVGGTSSSFGIWWEYIPEIHKILKKYNLKVTTLHTHIGSGSDPLIWEKVALMSLNTVKQFNDVECLNLGGGFKIARMPNEKKADMKKCGEHVKKAFKIFYEETGRKLKLEIEPGTFLVAKSGALIATIMDVVDTGKNGFKFLKTNTGMTEIARPSLYGSQHPIVIETKNKRKENVIITGHCCESGDILTPKEGDPEELAPRMLPKANIGDLILIDATGAYCSSMSTKNYNSYPEAPEVLIQKNNKIKLIRKKQTINQIIQNEL